MAQEANSVGQHQYVMISMFQGGVDSIRPDGPDTKTALEAGQKGSLIDAINKLAEYDYEMLPGTVIVEDVAIGGSMATVFMRRKK